MSCLLACSVDIEIRIMRFSPTLRHDTPFHAVQIALVEVSVKDFAQFHEFYAGELLNGRALSRTMGLDVAIVAFHPDCSLIFEAVFTSTGLIDMIVRWEFEEHDFWVNQRKTSLFSRNCLAKKSKTHLSTVQSKIMMCDF